MLYVNYFSIKWPTGKNYSKTSKQQTVFILVFLAGTALFGSGTRPWLASLPLGPVLWFSVLPATWFLPPTPSPHCHRSLDSTSPNPDTIRWSRAPAMGYLLTQTQDQASKGCTSHRLLARLALILCDPFGRQISLHVLQSFVGRVELISTLRQECYGVWHGN